MPLEDPIITETTSTLQEWGVLWKQLYVVSRTGFAGLRSHKTQNQKKKKRKAQNKLKRRLRGLEPRWDEHRQHRYLCILRWWDKGGSELYGTTVIVFFVFYFTLCFPNPAALPANAGSSRVVPSHVALTAAFSFRM